MQIPTQLQRLRQASQLHRRLELQLQLDQQRRQYLTQHRQAMVEPPLLRTPPCRHPVELLVACQHLALEPLQCLACLLRQVIHLLFTQPTLLVIAHQVPLVTVSPQVRQQGNKNTELPEVIHGLCLLVLTQSLLSLLAAALAVAPLRLTAAVVAVDWLGEIITPSAPEELLLLSSEAVGRQIVNQVDSLVTL